MVSHVPQFKIKRVQKFAAFLRKTIGEYNFINASLWLRVHRESHSLLLCKCTDAHSCAVIVSLYNWRYSLYKMCSFLLMTRGNRLLLLVQCCISSATFPLSSHGLHPQWHEWHSAKCDHLQAALTGHPLCNTEVWWQKTKQKEREKNGNRIFFTTLTKHLTLFAVTFGSCSRLEFLKHHCFATCY